MTAAVGHSEDELLRSLYAAHAGPLLGYVQRILGDDWANAEDIVQETLVRAWRQGDGLDERRARAWLYAVARNLAVDRYRRRRSRPVEISDEPLAALPAPDSLDAALVRPLVVEALRALRQAHREVLVEIYYRQRSIAEAAAVLGLPDGTVKSRTFYALRALRRELEARGVTEP